MSTLNGTDATFLGVPAADQAEITAHFANRAVLETLGGIAWRAREALVEKTRQTSDPLLDR